MEFEMAKEKAVRYLVTALRTENEVRLKLKRINCDDNVADSVIEYLMELNYIDDDNYIDAYIRQCNSMLQYSCYEIKNKLLQKGIKKEMLNDKIAVLKDSDYESRIKNKLLNGKLKNMEELKQKNYLYRRGFSIS